MTPKRYKHNLSHYHLFTGEMGDLIPAGCVEVLPCDTFRMNTSLLVRCEPLVRPVMHPVQVRIHHFFVPNRILWSGWEDFITGKAETNAPVRSIPEGSWISDYLGLHRDFDNAQELPIRAVNKCYNDYFRDQEIDAEAANNQLSRLRCRWEKDAYTGARTDSQRGDDAQALVVNNAVQARSIRRALAEQRFLEARTRYGNRYTEYLQYLGANPSDARLQRAEYLGGGRQIISFSEVLQTVNDAEGQSQDPLGQLGGHGITSVRTPTFQKMFEEHGFVLTFVSVRPKAMYLRHRHRMWDRLDYDDYWQKESELQGMQTIPKREIAANNDAEDDDLFGWNDQDYTYRSVPSRVSGEFRTTKKEWHLGRDFTQQPELNPTFIECNPSKRIFADQVAHGLNFMAQHTIFAKRLVRRPTAPRTV